MYIQVVIFAQRTFELFFHLVLFSSFFPPVPSNLFSVLCSQNLTRGSSYYTFWQDCETDFSLQEMKSCTIANSHKRHSIDEVLCRNNKRIGQTFNSFSGKMALVEHNSPTFEVSKYLQGGHKKMGKIVEFFYLRQCP